jgi:dihydrofolate reductase
MGRLVYTAICSLDGYTVDADGNFDWAMPDEEEHGFVNDLERPVGTYLYGRRMYQTMAVWQELGGPDVSAIENDYADIWRAADKVVFSTTLQEVTTPRTRLERAFDADVVRRLVAEADNDVGVGGSTLAASVVRAGLVEDLHLFLHPVVVGGGTRALPDGVRLDLDLVEEHRFGSGVVHLQFRLRS